MKTAEPKVNCPVCGCLCKIKGRTTRHYEPIIIDLVDEMIKEKEGFTEAVHTLTELKERIKETK